MVETLRLSDFRNYASLELALDPGLNVLFGQNAQGKTNVLEAAYLLSTTRLLRGSRDGEAVREGQRQARVSAELCRSHTELAIVIEAGRRKMAQLNRMNLPRASDLIGRLPTVCVSQADMPIVRGEPGERRLFMDLQLSQLYPSYLNHLAHYKRALEQRNALLRRAQEETVTTDEFETWEAPMAQHGAEIRASRRRFVLGLSNPAQDIHRRFSQGENLTLAYEAKDPAQDAGQLAQALAEGRPRDIARGSANSGPHRDDLALAVDGRDLRAFGSQGQQRTGVLSLKLACFHLEHDERGEKPMLLLDDIFSDLDESRRRQLVAWVLEHAAQAILTCTEPDAAGEELMERARLFRVHQAEVLPA